MNIYNNIKETKMFNKTYIRACFHPKNVFVKKIIYAQGKWYC